MPGRFGSGPQHWRAGTMPCRTTQTIPQALGIGGMVQDGTTHHANGLGNDIIGQPHLFGHFADRKLQFKIIFFSGNALKREASAAIIFRQCQLQAMAMPQ